MEISSTEYTNIIDNYMVDEYMYISLDLSSKDNIIDNIIDIHKLYKLKNIIEFIEIIKIHNSLICKYNINYYNIHILIHHKTPIFDNHKDLKNVLNNFLDLYGKLDYCVIKYTELDKLKPIIFNTLPLFYDYIFDCSLYNGQSNINKEIIMNDIRITQLEFSNNKNNIDNLILEIKENSKTLLHLEHNFNNIKINSIKYINIINRLINNNKKIKIKNKTLGKKILNYKLNIDNYIKQQNIINNNHTIFMNKIKKINNNYYNWIIIIIFIMNIISIIVMFIFNL